MSKRQYDGTPIDITWDNGPWANDGETVDATDTESGEIEFSMQSDTPPTIESDKAEIATYIRQQLLNGASVSDLREHYSSGVIMRAAKGNGAYEDVDADIQPIETDGRGPNTKWKVVDKNQDNSTTKDTSIPGETPTYHAPERDTNTKRLAAGVAIVALVSYVLGKLRGGQ